MKFGERLIQARKNVGLQQNQLAELLEISPQRLSYWENNKRQPDILMLKKIAKLLNVSLDYLVCMDDDPTPPKISSPGFAETAEPILNTDEKNIITKYRNINPEGQEKIRDYVDDIYTSPKYKKLCEPDVLLTKEEA